MNGVIMVEVREVIVPPQAPAEEAIEVFMSDKLYHMGDRLVLSDGRHAVVRGRCTETDEDDTVSQSLFVEFAGAADSSDALEPGVS